VNPHAETIVIGRILSHLHDAFAVESAYVTILEPASERGNGGVDELQEQTVSLLNFQQVETKIFGGQLAFNVLPQAAVAERTERRILNQLDAIFGKTFPKPALQVAQVPVFHSHSFSMFVNTVADPDTLARHLERNPAFALESAPEASPVGVVGSDKIHIQRMRLSGAGHALWVVADNLRIAASNAVQMAEHIMLAPALET
jgi:aspartate-semialdehyde dehydrogenase